MPCESLCRPLLCVFCLMKEGTTPEGSQKKSQPRKPEAGQKSEKRRRLEVAAGLDAGGLALQVAEIVEAAAAHAAPGHHIHMVNEGGE